MTYVFSFWDETKPMKHPITQIVEFEWTFNNPDVSFEQQAAYIGFRSIGYNHEESKKLIFDDSSVIKWQAQEYDRHLFVNDAESFVDEYNKLEKVKVDDKVITQYKGYHYELNFDLPSNEGRVMCLSEILSNIESKNNEQIDVIINGHNGTCTTCIRITASTDPLLGVRMLTEEEIDSADVKNPIALLQKRFGIYTG